MHQEAQGLQSTKVIDNEIYLKNIKRNIARLKRNVPKDSNIKDLLEKDSNRDFSPSITITERKNPTTLSNFFSIQIQKV